MVPIFSAVSKAVQHSDTQRRGISSRINLDSRAEKTDVVQASSRGQFCFAGSANQIIPPARPLRRDTAAAALRLRGQENMEHNDDHKYTYAWDDDEYRISDRVADAGGQALRCLKPVLCGVRDLGTRVQPNIA